MKALIDLLNKFVERRLINFIYQESQEIRAEEGGSTYYDFLLTPLNTSTFDNTLFNLLDKNFPTDNPDKPLLYELTNTQIKFTFCPAQESELSLLVKSFLFILEQYLLAINPIKPASPLPIETVIEIEVAQPTAPAPESLASSSSHEEKRLEESEEDKELLPEIDPEADKLPPVKTILVVGQFGAIPTQQRDPTIPEQLETKIRAALAELIKLLENRTTADTQGTSWLNPIARAKDFGQGVKNMSNSWRNKPVAINVKEQLKEFTKKRYDIVGYDFNHEELERLLTILQNRQKHIQKPHHKEEHTEEITLLASTMKDIQGLMTYRKFTPHLNGSF